MLQVHHKKYVKGLKAWEYPTGDCETLCKGCHGEEHGHVEPSHGWQYVGDSDLGGLFGYCERCGTELRYEFYIHHEKWGTKTVGTSCCDRMTGTQEASEYVDRIGRRKRFVASPRWKIVDGLHEIKQSGLEVKIAIAGEGFQVVIDGQAGRKAMRTLDEAKQLVFDVIESGDLQKWLEKRRQQVRT
ncbi:hypothetical protein [Hydrocarboniphaga effusa]|uniref:hypothetical protein n=1 Tax=Hydrocarboniphaga effusa TaxID=243629 RepID=UPI00398C0FF6